MPRLAICSRDLHWQWINCALLYDPIEVSMLRLAWLTTAQHVFQPTLTGRLELISRKNCLLRTRNKGYRAEQISRKIVSRKLGPRSYRDFAKNIALLGAKKLGPTCDRDISNSTIYTTAIYREYTVFARSLRPSSLTHLGHNIMAAIFQCTFLNENIYISINDIPALVQIMARRQPGDKPLSETMMV